MRGSLTPMVSDLAEKQFPIVIGDCNRAVAAAIAEFLHVLTTARQPSPVLAIAGRSGTGKTALLRWLDRQLRAAYRSSTMTSGDELLARTVQRARQGRTARHEPVADVLIIDSFEYLAPDTETVTETLWDLHRRIAPGTAVVVAETTAQGSTNTPATERLQRFLEARSSPAAAPAPVHRLESLDPETRRALVADICTRWNVDLDEEILSITDDDCLRSGAEVEGLVAGLAARHLLEFDPEHAEASMQIASRSRRSGAGAYEQALRRNLLRYMHRSPHSGLGISAGDFADMVLARLLEFDLNMNDEMVADRIQRTATEVAGVREAIVRIQDESSVKAFIDSVRP